MFVYRFVPGKINTLLFVDATIHRDMKSSLSSCIQAHSILRSDKVAQRSRSSCQPNNGWNTCQDLWTRVISEWFVALTECLKKNKRTFQRTVKSSRFTVSFQGTSRLRSAFIYLRWFKVSHIYVQVSTPHNGCKQGIDQQIVNRKSISCEITHPQSLFNRKKWSCIWNAWCDIFSSFQSRSQKHLETHLWVKFKTKKHDEKVNCVTFYLKMSFFNFVKFIPKLSVLVKLLLRSCA